MQIVFLKCHPAVCFLVIQKQKSQGLKVRSAPPIMGWLLHCAIKKSHGSVMMGLQFALYSHQSKPLSSNRPNCRGPYPSHHSPWRHFGTFWKLLGLTTLSPILIQPILKVALHKCLNIYLIRFKQSV